MAQNGNGGPWGNRGSDGNSPWGQGSGNNGGGPRKPQQGNDLDDLFRGLKEAFGGGGNSGDSKDGKGGRKGLQGNPFGILLLLVMASFIIPGVWWYTVDESEESVEQTFGRYTNTAGPGFHVKFPPPIETFERRQVDVVQDTEVGFISGSNGAPDRFNSRESIMLTGDENIVDVAFVVQWQISNLENFVFKIDAPEQAIKAVAESAMREVVGKTDLDPVITTGRQEVANEVSSLMQEMLDEYDSGVLVRSVNIRKAEAPAQVIEEFRDVVNAAQDAETKINEATREANRTVPEARGNAARVLQEAEAYRDRVIAEAEGETERFRLIYEEYRKSPRVIRDRMYLERMEELYKNSDKIIIDDDVSGGVLPYLSIEELRRKPGGSQ